jgi:hypothetical protein
MELGLMQYRKMPYSRLLHACWTDQVELERLTELARTPLHWYDSVALRPEETDASETVIVAETILG